MLPSPDPSRLDAGRVRGSIAPSWLGPPPSPSRTRTPAPSTRTTIPAQLAKFLLLTTASLCRRPAVLEPLWKCLSEFDFPLESSTGVPLRDFADSV